MTYQGERARPEATEVGRSFEISKIRVDGGGHISDVLWNEVGAASDRPVGAPTVAPVAEVVDALHDGARVVAVFAGSQLPQRPFVVIEHENGRECIVLGDAPAPGRELADIARLDG